EKAAGQDGGVVADPGLALREQPGDALDRCELAGHRSPTVLSAAVQGVVKTYDPGTGEGTIVRDLDRSEYELAAGALAGSVFRMLRQGQRVIFDVDDRGLATGVRLGSEVDMGSPADPPPPPS